jgi:hypothetical protein
MASASSHRHTVRPLIEATIPRRTASRAMSEQLNRDKGTSCSAGSWQARALTSTTASGGEKARPPPSRPVFQADQTLLEKPLSPLADDLPGQIQPLGNLRILEPLGCQQNHLGANNSTIR